MDTQGLLPEPPRATVSGVPLPELSRFWLTPDGRRTTTLENLRLLPTIPDKGTRVSIPGRVPDLLSVTFFTELDRDRQPTGEPFTVDAREPNQFAIPYPAEDGLELLLSIPEGPRFLTVTAGYGPAGDDGHPSLVTWGMYVADNR